MRTIPAQTIGRFAARVRQLSEAAGDSYDAIIGRLYTTYEDIEQEWLIEQLTDLADGIGSMRGDAAAMLAADMYLEIAELWGIVKGDIAIADPAPRKLIYDRLKKYAKESFVDGVFNFDAFRKKAVAMVKSDVKRQANQTVIQQAVRDGVLFARVPQGPETCAFCIMLASQGFVYASAENAALHDHNHENCDCIVVPAFGPGSIEGYSDQKYKDLYYSNAAHGDGDNTAATLNNMRRALYEGNDEFPGYKDRRNQLRREAYARKKALEAEQS